MVETTRNIYPQWNNGTQFRLNEINRTKTRFVVEIHEREILRHTLCKYIAALDYFDKTLLVFSAKSCGVSICSIATVFDASVGITSASLSLKFSISKGTFWKNFKNIKKKEKKHNKIVLVATSKLKA